MSVFLRTTLLLTLSNVFMTFAWYAHLKDQASKPWYVAALCVMGAVFFMFRAQS
jgi:uncharacterized protein (DUF486 family)